MPDKCLAAPQRAGSVSDRLKSRWTCWAVADTFRSLWCPSKKPQNSHQRPPTAEPRALLAALRGVIILAVMLVALPAMAQTGRYGDVAVTVHSPWPLQSLSSGYASYRFTLTNHGNQDRQVTLTLPDQTWSSGHAIRSLSRTAAVPAGASVQVSLLQPPVELTGSGVRVAVDGRVSPQRLVLGLNTTGVRPANWRHQQHRLVFAGQRITGPVRERLEQIVTFQDTGRPVSALLERADSDASQWPTQWLAYTGFHSIVLMGDEHSDLPPAVREAIYRYVETGGDLVLIGDPIDRRLMAASWQQPADRMLGDQTWSMGQAGFGSVWLVSPEVLQQTAPEAAKLLRTQWQVAADARSSSLSIMQANEKLPVAEHLGVPVRGMLGLMFVFTMVAGPANLWLLSRKNRRIWMLWTVPALAGVFSLAVFAYASLGEGWQADARVKALTLLDETTQRASTIGWVGYYSPLTPGDGLRFSDQTEITPQIAMHGRHGGSEGGTAREVDWTHGQHLSSGWISARVPTHLAIRKSETRRERVTISRDDQGRLTAVNGLGVPIQQLYVADGQRRIFAAEQVDAGARVVLEQIEDLGRLEPAEWSRLIHQQSWPQMIERLHSGHAIPPVHRPSGRPDPPASRLHFLHANTYLALTDQTPFVEPGLAKANWLSTPSAVLGIMREPIDGN